MVAAVLAMMLTVAGASALIVGTTGNLVYDMVADVPAGEVALVLGAGLSTDHLQPRLDAARKLYVAGKVSRIVVSGSRDDGDYDEPTAMRRDLVRQGIPEAHIDCDFGGFRTLDSVLRARRVFGLTQVTIVTQRFHLYRALYIARQEGIEAVGYAASDPGDFWNDSSHQRERLARVLALIDLHVTGRQPQIRD